MIQAEWLTDFPVAKLGSLSFYRTAKSRWEIENLGFNDGKNRNGMEHICHHEPNSILIVWLLIALALVIETALPVALSTPRRAWRSLRHRPASPPLVDPGIPQSTRYRLTPCRADGWQRSAAL